MSWRTTWVLPVVLGVTASVAEAQHPLPFSADRYPPAALRHAMLVPIQFHVPSGSDGCDQWLVDLLVRVDDRWLRVSSAVQDADMPETMTISGLAARESLVVLQCRGQAGYSVHGPFVWRQEASPTRLDFRRRRTVRVSDDLGSRSGVSLLMSDERSDLWPVCRSQGAGDHECIGVPFAIPAVAVAVEDGVVRWALVPPAHATIQRVSTQRSRWGRLLRLVDVSGVAAEGLIVKGWRQTPDPRAQTSLRVRLAGDAAVGVYPIAPLAFWVAGQGHSDQEFVEVKGANIITVRIDTALLRHGQPDDPFPVLLRPGLPVQGTVLDSRGRRTPGAIVSAFEFVRADASSEPSATPRRWIAESVSDGNGDFAIRGLDAATYEFLAVHPTRGRLFETRRVDGTPVVLQLVGTRLVKGRVFVGQVPAAGVEVRFVPDSEEFQAAKDPLALVAAPGQTDRDGRFELALPGEGSGEVVIGGSGLAKSRYRFSGGDESSVNDMGDIHLPAPFQIVVRLVSPGCDLMAAGPVGSLGLELVRGLFDPVISAYRLQLPESGFWWLEAQCGPETRGVVPPVVQISDDAATGVIDATLAPVAPPN